MNRLLWLILIILWICLAVFCCHQQLCNSGAAAADGCSTWKIMDGSRFSKEYNSNVKFMSGSDQYISETDVDGALNDVANYLNNNGSRVLTIVGYYSSSENYSNTNFPNLGVARADDIRDYLLNAGVPANQLKVNGVEYNENCYNGDKLNRGARFMFGS